MLFSPLLRIHIGGGILEILSGTAALSRAAGPVCERKNGACHKVPVKGIGCRGIALGALVEKPSHLSSEYGCLVHKTDWIVERVIRIK
jgi:hypothetical protein